MCLQHDQCYCRCVKDLAHRRGGESAPSWLPQAAAARGLLPPPAGRLLWAAQDPAFAACIDAADRALLRDAARLANGGGLPAWWDGAGPAPPGAEGAGGGAAGAPACTARAPWGACAGTTRAVFDAFRGAFAAGVALDARLGIGPAPPPTPPPLPR